MITTLATVKAFKNIATAEHDAELTRLIPAVDAFIAQYCNRVLEQATVTEFHSTRSGQRDLRLRQYPVASITSIHDDPLRVYAAASLIPAANYVLTHASAGLVQLDGRTFGSGLNNVRIIYVGGFAAGAPELALLGVAAIELIWLARDKGDLSMLGLRAKSIGDGNVSVLNQDWPAGVQAILDGFRRLDH